VTVHRPLVLTAALLAVALLAACGGGDSDDPDLPTGVQIVEHGSDEIDWPAHLSALPGEPATIAVDGNTGDLLILVLPPTDAPLLYRNPAGTTELEITEIDAPPGPYDHRPGLAVDGRGRTLLWLADELHVFEPEEPPAVEQVAGPVSSSSGTLAARDGTAFTLGSDGKVLEHFINDGSERVVNTGQIVIHTEALNVTRNALWLTQASDYDPGPAPRLVRLDLGTGETQLRDLRVDSIHRYGENLFLFPEFAELWEDGRFLGYLGACDDTSGDSPGKTAAPRRSTPRQFVSVFDQSAEEVWVAGSREIMRRPLSCGEEAIYELPYYKDSGREGGPNGQTLVTAMVLDLDRRLYFTDAAGNRIGVIDDTDPLPVRTYRYD
jgi:hypothetical protein